MNKLVQQIKNAALATASQADRKNKYVLDTEGDENEVTKLFLEHGLATEAKATHHRSKFVRWDVEGENDGKLFKAEVKSRTYGADYDTWIIDTYKIDYLVDHFEEQDLYFVNVFEGVYHVYDAREVAECEKITRRARFKDGTGGIRTYYQIPKNLFKHEWKDEK